MVQAKRKRGKPAAAVLIVLLSASLGVLADWRAPGVSRYAKDWLMRQRGTLPVPGDIAIVAIDEKSIAALGRFPWPRQVLADTLEMLKRDEPKVIAMDVLFPDPTTPEEDAALARAVSDAGNVVLAAQLVDSPVHGGPATWLSPIPPLAHAAQSIGHVNVQVESEGTARQIAVQAADDAGETRLAMPVEAVKVADRIPPQGVSFNGSALVMGSRAIPLEVFPTPVLLGQSGAPATRLQTGRMTIDYIGPAGAFEPVTFSLVDVMHGAFHGRFHDKYVLIGATAATLGDRIASPFQHQTDAHADEHGVMMPGVEVLANALNTILRSRYYSETGDAGAFLWAALVAALTLFLLEHAQGRLEMVRQAGALFLLAAAMVFAAELEFDRLLVFPPLVACLFSLAVAGILSLLWRSFLASSRLEESIEQLSQSSGILPAPSPRLPTAERSLLPHGLEWKAQKVGHLNAALVERARFVEQALRSVEDGLIIATPQGVITFANRSAGDILGTPPRILAGQELLQCLTLTDPGLLRRVVRDRARVEREIEIREARPRRFTLRMAAVEGGENGGGVVSGIVVSLSDVTRQHELQQTKNDVIALVSHEMRTPLTAIQGMTELLANYEIDPDRRKEISSAINGEVKRLTGMITEYLDITRLESGATALRKTPVRVEPLLQRIVLLLEPVAAQRGIRITLALSPSLPVLFADSDLLGRAVENLVSNAIKYSPASTGVTIRAEPEHGGIAISVSDQGYGIPEPDLPRIFEKFYRVPRVEDAGVPGTGLGLALVREIAELHGGAASVTSKVNQGSTFILRIPAREAVHPG